MRNSGVDQSDESIGVLFVYAMHRNCVFGQQSIANTGFNKDVDTLNMEKKRKITLNKINFKHKLFAAFKN